MKMKYMKRILISVCFAVFMFASVLGLAISMPMHAPAFADDTAWQTEGVFEMDDGVSLQFSQVGGMRFKIKMDEELATFVKDTEGASLGVIIAPQNLMEAARDAGGDYANMSKKIGGEIRKETIYQEGEFYYANGCITNVKYDNLTRNFVAVAYMQYGGKIRYTEYNSLARNNLYDLVNMATLNGLAKEVFEAEDGYSPYVDTNADGEGGWYGTELFPIVIENTQEYDKFVEAVNDGVDFTDYCIVVKNSATPSIGYDENVVNKPTVIDSQVFELNALIEALPDSVTMPDAIGVIGRIRDAEKRYNALSETQKGEVEDYAKVQGLLSAIDGYDRVYKNDATDGTVIPSYVPNYTSTVGGSATTRQDDVYGNVLTVTSDANGKAALHFQNFPSVAKYTNIYFYVKVSVGCDFYMSDGITNDGWGANWKNTWSVSGYWCNAGTWRLVTVPVSEGYIGTDFALGFRADATGFTFEISDFYGVLRGDVQTGMSFGNFTDTGTTNEYGTVYNFTQGWASNTDLGAFNPGALRGCLTQGHDSLRFYIYNPNESDVLQYFTENETWARTNGSTLTAKAWTEVIITPEVIASNDKYSTYVNVESGAGTSGWQISPIYSFNSNPAYTDYADVKATIALIDAISDSVTLDDEDAVVAARNAYNSLTASQQSYVSNYATLTAAENVISDLNAANEVIALIDSINPRAVDETAVANARAAYNALSDTAKAYVTNLETLESYEAAIKEEDELQTAVDNVVSLIAVLPDSVVMPDNLVFVPRIEAAESAYNALSDEGKGKVTNYAKLKTLVDAIKGYDTIHIQTVDSVNVIPSHVPNYTSTIGGTATIGNDSYYGNYLKVTPNAGGIVAIQYLNFPNVSQYEKIYFNIRVVGASCDIYLSDGITNDGWGDGWNNTWSISGLWANDGNWIQKEFDLTGTYTSGDTTKYIKNIFASNWALGLRTDTTDVYFEITDIVGVKPDLGEVADTSFGNITDTGTTNIYGTVYNFTQGWDSETDLGAFKVGILNGALKEGHDALRFYIYNPNESDVVFYVSEDETWIETELATLKAQNWTEVVFPPEVIESNNTYLTYICVRAGANTSGWQISPIYSFSLGDTVDKVQARIDALDTENIEEYKVQLAREAFEELNELQKALVDTTKLIACESELYGDVENAPFIESGATQYKMYVEQDDKVKAAAAFANEHITAATGASLAVVTDTPQNMSKYRYAIVFGYWDIYEELGGTKAPTSITSRAGYVIEKMGRTVFILANTADGYRMGALAFLNGVVGYDMISEDCIVYDGSKAETLPEFNTVGDPFDYRQQQTYMTEEEIYGMGLQLHTDIWIDKEGWDMHNTLDYLPTETYRSLHPSWYYDYTDSYNVSRTDICPTAGGNTEQYDIMTATIAELIIERITARPTIENICFSMEDAGDGGECTCERCTEYTNLYGSFAAAWVDLMNDINGSVQAYINTNMPGRTLHIAFLAYRATEAAPANDDYTPKYRYEMDGKEFVKENGAYVQDSEEFRCDENVAVWLAPINGKYAENFNHEDNAATLATIKKWAAISNNLYIWLYGTNFKNYMYPYNSWQASAENYKILKELGVKAVWSQSNETEATAFSDLKGYIDSKFMADVNADYETVLNSYFTNYFGAASATMRSLFDKIVTYCNDIEANNDGLGRGIYDELEYSSGGFLGWGATTKSYWSESQINELMTLINQAYEDIASLESSNSELYQKLYNRITKESLFPRYVLCTVYASSYSTSEKKSMRQAFKADAEALGVTLYKESDGLLSDLYSDWGL